MKRSSRKYQKYVTKHAKARAAREEKRIHGIHPEYPSELPKLRGLIKITGTPVTRQLNYISVTVLIASMSASLQ